MRIILCLFVFSLSACYSFKGISIDPDVSTFLVENVEDQTGSSPANYPQEFGFALSNKIRRETRLAVKNVNPDLRFKCTITRFNIESIAPTAGQTSAVNRVTVGIKIECTNSIRESGSWTRDFSKFEDFPPDQNFVNVQASVLDNINKLILEDIFNSAFSNW